MPGADYHLGQDRHVRLVREQSFGTLPGSPTWHSIPILGDGWKVGGSRALYRPNMNVAPGHQAKRIVIPHGHQPDGTFTTLPFPEQAGFLLDAALEHDGDGDLYSYQAEYYTPEDPRVYQGLVVSTLTITASGTGDGDVQIELDFMGKAETPDDTIVEGDFDYSSLTLVPFMFRDASLEVNDQTVTDVEEWTITVENNLQEGPFVGDERAYLLSGVRTITLELTKLNNHDGFRQAMRSGLEMSFSADFTHPSGHYMALRLPRLHVPETDEDGTPDQAAKESPTLEAAYDSGYGYDIDYGVDTGPTTTTLGDITTTSAWF